MTFCSKLYTYGILNQRNYHFVPFFAVLAYEPTVEEVGKLLFSCIRRFSINHTKVLGPEVLTQKLKRTNAVCYFKSFVLNYFRFFPFPHPFVSPSKPLKMLYSPKGYNKKYTVHRQLRKMIEVLISLFTDEDNETRQEISIICKCLF